MSNFWGAVQKPGVASKNAPICGEPLVCGGGCQQKGAKMQGTQGAGRGLPAKMAENAGKSYYLRKTRSGKQGKLLLVPVCGGVPSAENPEK